MTGRLLTEENFVKMIFNTQMIFVCLEMKLLQNYLVQLIRLGKLFVLMENPSLLLEFLKCSRSFLDKARIITWYFPSLPGKVCSGKESEVLTSRLCPTAKKIIILQLKPQLGT